MLETAMASMRFGVSTALGRRFHVGSLERLVAAMRDTVEEFGGIGSDSAELVRGPALDPETRRMLQGRRFRAQAVRAATGTAHYRHLFAGLGIDPSTLTYDDIPRVPVTPKATLRDAPDTFVASGTRPSLVVTSTGTTGRPTRVSFSEYEVRVIRALAAMVGLAQRHVEPDDHIVVAISTRATLGVDAVSAALRAAGGPVHVAGLVSPEHTLALLTERIGGRPQVSVLSTYPSHLGELLTTARHVGLGPGDFGLRRVFVGGELLTEGLRRRCRDVFGAVDVLESYGMTELLPFGATHCSQGHLHFEAGMGLVELLRLDADVPAAPGEAARLVATPFPPYRETTLLLRYDTEDVVLAPEGPLDCELRNVPATSRPLGKLRLAVRSDRGWTLVRDVAEALESVDAVPLPARYGFRAEGAGVAVEVAAPATARAAVGAALEAGGVPLTRLDLADEPGELRRPLPLRCDLRSSTFDLRRGLPAPALAGSGGA